MVQTRSFLSQSPRRGFAAPSFLVLLLAACGSPTTPDRFQASDFFGEWSLQVAATSCWQPLDIVFAIDRGGVEREGHGSMGFSSRWGSPTDPARTKLVNGSLHWLEPRASNFAVAFFQSGVVLGQLVGNGEGMSADSLAGFFFDPNRQTCRADATARKVAA